MFSANCNKNTLLSNLCFSKWSIQQITVLLRKGFFFIKKKKLKQNRYCHATFFCNSTIFQLQWQRLFFQRWTRASLRPLFCPRAGHFLRSIIQYLRALAGKKLAHVGRKKSPARIHPYILSLLLQHEYYTSLKPFYFTKM